MSKQKRPRQTARNIRIPVKDKVSGKTSLVKPEELTGVFQLTPEQCREMAVQRIALNLKETGHPFHHKTANGAIVTPDPTLQYLMSRLSGEQLAQFTAIYAPTPEQEVKTAMPVNRTFYGRDMYEEMI